MAERKDYYLAVYVPASCFGDKHFKDEYIHGNSMHTLREIDKLTCNFISKKQLVYYCLDKICEDTENTFGIQLKARNVMKEYKSRNLDAECCIKIAKKDKRKDIVCYSNDIVLSDDSEIIDVAKGKPDSIRKLVIDNSLKPEYIDCVVEKYNNILLSRRFLNSYISNLYLNKQSKEQLILEILDSVRNDVISEYMVKQIIQKYTNNEKLSEIKAKIIVDKHKRMNGLRQKIEKIEQSKDDELQNVFEFIDFATYMTNDFSKYSSCRKIYFFTEKFNEKENAYKVKVKK